MKKYTSYIIIGLVGILIGISVGKLIFNDPPQEVNHQHDDTSTKAKSEEYTCSMHPQIRQNEPGICPICEMDLIPVGSMDSGNDPTVLKMTPSAVKLAQIATSPVASGQSVGEAAHIEVEGTLKIDESLTNVQAAHIGGRIDQLYVSFEGQYIKKGQLIATLYAAELLLATKELLTAVKNEEQFPGLKDAAIQKVKNWRISDEQIQKVINSGKPIQDINLYADYNGYITERLVSEGDHVNEGDLLYRLASTSRLWVEFNVFERDIPNIKVGQNVIFSGPALATKKIETTISHINPQLDSGSRSVIARTIVSNPNNMLKPGMLIRGQIKREVSSSHQLLVPKTAVLWTGKRSVVYVSHESEEGITEYQYREVTLGEQVGAYYQILSGLKGHEEVVTRGAFTIDAAAQLNNKFSMMNHDVGIKKDQIRGRTPDFKNLVSDSFRSSLEQYVKAYLKMKDALVETDAISTSKTAAAVLKELESIPHVSLEPEAHEFWMNKFNPIKVHLQNMMVDAEMAGQRKQFEFVSELTIDLIEAFGMKERSYYIQYCPMAFNNKGAEWISDEIGIRNPYFGDKMLTCGSVIDTIGLKN